MTTVQMPRAGDWRTRARHRLSDAFTIGRRRAGEVLTKARASRLALASPGIVGAAMISAGAGLKAGLWLGLIVGGLFALRVDGRI
jgi:hypothetical protein